MFVTWDAETADKMYKVVFTLSTPDVIPPLAYLIGVDDAQCTTTCMARLQDLKVVDNKRLNRAIRRDFLTRVREQRTQYDNAVAKSRRGEQCCIYKGIAFMSKERCLCGADLTS